MKKLSALLVMVLLCVAFLVPQRVEAAQAAGNVYMRASRMQAGQAPGNVLVVFTTSSATTAEATFRNTLDSEWVSTTNFSTGAGAFTVTATGIPAGTTAMPGVAAGTATGNTISFPVTAMATSTTYAFIITGGLTLNPAASTTQIHTLFTADSGVVTLDTKDIAVPTITADQISVTASVPPSFTFVLGTTTANLGVLSTGAISSGAGNTLTITTNAGAGWTAWVKDANAGLTSANVTYTIPTAGTLDNAPSTIAFGTEGYVLDVDKTVGPTVTVATEYDGTTTAQGGTLSSTTFQAMASSTGVASGDILTLIPRVAISGVTKAASDYADTITVVGAGIF